MKWQEVGERCVMRASKRVLFPKYNEDIQVQYDDMGSACSMSWERRNACRLLV
jgi:hypothetical protein